MTALSIVGYVLLGILGCICWYVMGAMWYEHAIRTHLSDINKIDLKVVAICSIILWPIIYAISVLMAIIFFFVKLFTKKENMPPEFNQGPPKNDTFVITEDMMPKPNLESSIDIPPEVNQMMAAANAENVEVKE